MILYHNKAAMFGLDARIALAIFGALSVISGAALYSAIKTAKTEQWRQFFVEHEKASEAYYLDNGSELPVHDPAHGSLNAVPLVTNSLSLSTWQGPYIEGTAYASYAILSSQASKIPENSTFMIYLRQASTWTEMNDTTADEFCAVNNADCAEWLLITPHTATGATFGLQLFKDLDELIDNSDGALAGKLRYNNYGTGLIMYKGRMRQRTS